MSAWYKKRAMTPEERWQKQEDAKKRKKKEKGVMELASRNNKRHYILFGRRV